jgi:hypothetical protein
MDSCQLKKSRLWTWLFHDLVIIPELRFTRNHSHTQSFRLDEHAPKLPRNKKKRRAKGYISSHRADRED